MLASKIQKLVAKLATRTSAILHFPNVMLYIVKCKPPFWLHRYFKSKLGKPFHLTLQYNEFFQLSFFLMAPNFLALATTLENLGARWLLAKKVNFVPCGGHIAHPFSQLYWQLFPPSSPKSGKYRVRKYSSDCISVTVPLEGASHRVATLVITSQLHYPLRHRLLSSSIVHQFKNCNSENLTIASFSSHAWHATMYKYGN